MRVCYRLPLRQITGLLPSCGTEAQCRRDRQAAQASGKWLEGQYDRLKLALRAGAWCMPMRRVEGQRQNGYLWT